jgi:hypothetical protein
MPPLTECWRISFVQPAPREPTKTLSPSGAFSDNHYNCNEVNGGVIEPPRHLRLKIFSRLGEVICLDKSYSILTIKPLLFVSR